MKYWNQALFAFLTLVQFPLSAQAIRETGGGGAWVCREADHSIRWTKLVDLFEAEEHGLQISNFTGSYEGIVDEVAARLKRAAPEAAGELSPFLNTVSYFRGAQVHFITDTLETIHDAYYDIKPSVDRCAAGQLVVDLNSGELMIPYEQMVNYKADGDILVQEDLFKKLSETEKAALVFHEAFYAFRRLRFGDQDSRLTREVVAWLFSTKQEGELGEKIRRLGFAQAGPDLPDWKFVSLPAGTFLMTSESPVPFAVDVSISGGIEMQTTQVTQMQWYKLMGLIPPTRIHTRFQFDRDTCPNSYRETNGGGVCVDYALVGVTRAEVAEFIARLNQKDGLYRYRLPTDAEWAYSATAGGNIDFPFGSNWIAEDYIWLNGSNGWGNGVNMPPELHPVASKKANPWGLFDMYALHFTQDWYSEVPVGGRDPRGPISGNFYVRRGCWKHYSSEQCRANSRDRESVGANDLFEGFRLVRERK